MGGRNYAATIDKDTHMITTPALKTTPKRKSPIKTLPPVPAAAPVATTSPTKQAQLIELLRRDGGASIGELVTALDWLPHTTRAALTGLRKKGHDVVKAKVDEVTRYRIAQVVAEIRA